MSEDGIPEGIITRDEVADLAFLFDCYEFAFDPLFASWEEPNKHRVARPAEMACNPEVGQKIAGGRGLAMIPPRPRRWPCIRNPVPDIPAAPLPGPHFLAATPCIFA